MKIEAITTESLNEATLNCIHDGPDPDPESGTSDIR